jgi:endoglucanase
MDADRRELLDRLLETPRPSGYEAETQRVWLEAVEPVADSVRTDAYGNAIATLNGQGPEIAVAGHADQIGFLVRRIDEDGFLHPESVGGADRTVSRGQQVTVHAESPVAGVVGQTAIHQRDRDDDGTPVDVNEQRIDIGAADGDAAREVVSVGDPITIDAPAVDLQGTRIAGRGMDNRVGIWTAAETLRRAAEADVAPTIHAVSTVQEEVGIKGAQMVGFDLNPDAAIAVDVCHASDNPAANEDQGSDVELGGGPAIGRGSANHPELVDLVRDASEGADVAVQYKISGSRTGTDADGFFVSSGGIPSLNLGIPNRYMHTPVEVVDLEDLDAAVDLLVAAIDDAGGRDGFAVDV